MNTGDKTVQMNAWREMLLNHAQNQWSIGTISGALQPIVIRDGLQGLPAKALYSWEPTAMIGIYRADEIYWNKAAGKEARR
jgi:peptide/nickel transport system substrate-binding protein